MSQQGLKRHGASQAYEHAEFHLNTVSSFRRCQWLAHIRYNGTVAGPPIRFTNAAIVPSRRQPLSSGLLRVFLLMSAFALIPAAMWAQPAAVAPGAALEASISTLDVPIEEIAASASGCAILDKDFPQLREHVMYEFFKSMTLNQIAAMSRGKITPDMLAQARADLSALSFKPAAVPQTDVDDPTQGGDQALLSEPAKIGE